MTLIRNQISAVTSRHPLISSEGKYDDWLRTNMDTIFNDLHSLRESIGDMIGDGKRNDFWESQFATKLISYKKQDNVPCNVSQILRVLDPMKDEWNNNKILLRKNGLTVQDCIKFRCGISLEKKHIDAYCEVLNFVVGSESASLFFAMRSINWDATTNDNIHRTIKEQLSSSINDYEFVAAPIFFKNGQWAAAVFHTKNRFRNKRARKTKVVFYYFSKEIKEVLQHWKKEEFLDCKIEEDWVQLSTFCHEDDVSSYGPRVLLCIQRCLVTSKLNCHVDLCQDVVRKFRMKMLQRILDFEQRSGGWSELLIRLPDLSQEEFVVILTMRNMTIRKRKVGSFSRQVINRKLNKKQKLLPKSTNEYICTERPNEDNHVDLEFPSSNKEDECATNMVTEDDCSHCPICKNKLVGVPKDFDWSKEITDEGNSKYDDEVKRKAKKAKKTKNGRIRKLLRDHVARFHPHKPIWNCYPKQDQGIRQKRDICPATCVQKAYKEACVLIRFDNHCPQDCHNDISRIKTIFVLRFGAAIGQLKNGVIKSLLAIRHIDKPRRVFLKTESEKLIGKHQEKLEMAMNDDAEFEAQWADYSRDEMRNFVNCYFLYDQVRSSIKGYFM